MTRNASQAVFGGVFIEAVCCVFVVSHGTLVWSVGGEPVPGPGVE